MASDANNHAEQSVASKAEIARRVITAPDAAIRIESITLSPEWQQRLRINVARPNDARTVYSEPLKKSG